MIGMLLWKEPVKGEKTKRIQIGRRSVLQMQFLCAEIARGEKTSELLLRRSILRAARRLRKEGVTQVVLPEAFPYGDELVRCGLRAVSTLPLRRALAAELVRAQLDACAIVPAQARIAVCGEYLTGELVRAVTQLALRYRYVFLDLPSGGEALCRQLRREYGVSVVFDPARSQLETADVFLLFREQEEFLQKRERVLVLYEDGAVFLPPLQIPQELEKQLPQGAERMQLLSALAEGGALRREQIVIGTLQG